MSYADNAVILVATVLLGISLLNPGGGVVGGMLAVFLLAAWFGGKYLLELEKSRRMGERSNTFRDRFAGSDDEKDKWSR